MAEGESIENDFKSDKMFGDWVYCAQHMNPHLTGWCTVRNDDKIGLGSFEGTHDEQAAKAAKKCREFDLPLFEDDFKGSVYPRLFRKGSKL